MVPSLTSVAGGLPVIPVSPLLLSPGAEEVASAASDDNLTPMLPQAMITVVRKGDVAAIQEAMQNKGVVFVDQTMTGDGYSMVYEVLKQGGIALDGSNEGTLVVTSADCLRDFRGEYGQAFEQLMATIAEGIWVVVDHLDDPVLQARVLAARGHHLICITKNPPQDGRVVNLTLPVKEEVKATFRTERICEDFIRFQSHPQACSLMVPYAIARSKGCLTDDQELEHLVLSIVNMLSDRAKQHLHVLCCFLPNYLPSCLLVGKEVAELKRLALVNELNQLNPLVFAILKKRVSEKDQKEAKQLISQLWSPLAAIYCEEKRQYLFGLSQEKDYAGMGSGCFLIHCYTDALSHFHNALMLKQPLSQEQLYQLGKAEFIMGHYQEALRHLQDLVPDVDREIYLDALLTQVHIQIQWCSFNSALSTLHGIKVLYDDELRYIAAWQTAEAMVYLAMGQEETFRQLIAQAGVNFGQDEKRHDVHYLYYILSNSLERLLCGDYQSAKQLIDTYNFPYGMEAHPLSYEIAAMEGLIAWKSNQYILAATKYEEALKDLKTYFGTDCHPRIADLYLDLSAVYVYFNQRGIVEEYRQKALAIRRQFFPSGHIKLRI
ncbi:MAG: tetratricopeptide repeat protein [Chlamydiia bacterium]|nr:tetratricopeptide repeat protein [Chlamydiia bacterium]